MALASSAPVRGQCSRAEKHQYNARQFIVSLAPGTRIGPYEVAAPLGAGNMGEVYRAVDTSLKRPVAIKILPDRVADDADRAARFEREAELLAALNHPNIAVIHGLERAQGNTALIMELVEGPTLGDLIARGPLRVSESVAIAGQIAAALTAAHARGIIHRDLKPANIKVRPDGTVKVLDFGLAKMIEVDRADRADAATVTSHETRAGVVLGSPAYMSPEQARGEPVDARTDIWALGCVLFEMVTGHRAYGGRTAPDTFAAILEGEPDWTRLPDGSTGSLRPLLRSCLQKDRNRRLRDAADVRIWLEDPALLERSRNGSTASRSRWTSPALVGTVAVLGAAAGAGLWHWTRPSEPAVPHAVVRTAIALPTDLQLHIGGQSAIALSPDGRRLVFVAQSGGETLLYLRPLDRFDATPLAGTTGARYPFFSPDGASVAFFAGEALKRVSIHGGAPVTVCAAPVASKGGSWGPDGTIVFNPETGGLMRVSDTGGAAEPLTTKDPTIDANVLQWPRFLPHGRALLANTLEGELLALALDSRTWHSLGPGTQPQYASSGHLVFHAPHAREGEIRAVGFDLERLTTHGDPVTVVDEVFRSPGSGFANIELGRDGTLVYVPGGHARTLVRVDNLGVRTPLLPERRGFRLPVVSPDGRRIAVTIDPRPSQIWVYDVERQTGIPLVTEGHSFRKVWTPDGRSITYATNGQLYSRVADASAEARSLGHQGSPEAWTNDGRSLLFALEPTISRPDIWILSGGGPPVPLIATRSVESQAALSPDERWLAYQSDESGRLEVYVRPFPDVQAAKWPVSTGGGGSPAWSPNGRALFYMRGTAIMAVPVETRGNTFRAGAPRQLFTGPFETGLQGFGVFPDGTFAMVEADPAARPTQIQVVVNWLDELRRLAPRR